MSDAGEKLQGAYDPSGVEKRIYEFWRERDCFAAPIDPVRPPLLYCYPSA